MHQLTRPTTAPACLSRYCHGTHQWTVVAFAEKAEIWVKLDEMQQGRCAYCECTLPVQNDRYTAHIEHFRQRGSYPQGAFDWDNLFGSCNRTDSCGKHKDNKCGECSCNSEDSSCKHKDKCYTPADLIKPDIENPEHFFLFVVDGSIAIRQGLSAAEQHRAKETLRIFNLDPQRGALRQMRFSAVQGYIQTAEALVAISADFTEDELRVLFQQELEAVEHLPFVTAIKHILTTESL